MFSKIKNKNKYKYNLNLSGLRSFSTFNSNSEKFNDTVSELEISSLVKELAIKEFKKSYSDGYLGYTDIYSFGNISTFFNVDDSFSRDVYIESLESDFKTYLKGMPENTTYSILPIIRWQLVEGGYKSITISESIKITRFTNCSLLAERVFYSLQKALIVYETNGIAIDLVLLSRPWLNINDFKFKLPEVTDTLNDHLEKEVSYFSSFTPQEQKKLSNKVKNIKNYIYKDIIMNKYGEPVLDKNFNLIGYKLINDRYASIETYYNENNLLCNKVSIKDFDTENLSFKGEALITWIDTKTEFGFTRELNNSKYYYGNKNNLINLEVKYNQPKFSIYAQDASLNPKIGVIDFETYGANLGLGNHNVYAAGFSLNNHTELFYIEPGKTSEDFVNRFFFQILMNQDLNDYTIYVHNLGRFDSIFILKSLNLNENITLTPLWKDTSILSLIINYYDTKITLLDSLQLIPSKLEDILESFKCKIQKSKFPYNFVNKKTLFYIGNKPSKEFYVNISDQEYSSIKIKDWDLKKETLNYLK